jgi:hypothetical protein
MKSAMTALAIRHNLISVHLVGHPLTTPYGLGPTSMPLRSILRQGTRS